MPFEPAKNLSKLLVLGMVLLIIALSFLIIRPFLIAVISAAVLAYLCYPLYKLVYRKLPRKSIAASMVIAVLLLLVALPAYYIVHGLYNETRMILQNYSYNTFLQAFSPEISSLLAEGINKMIAFFATKASEFIFSLPALFLSFFILIASLYYFLKDGPEIFEKLESLLPLNSGEKQLFHREFQGVASGVVYGALLTGIIEGVLGAIGFYLFGISSPILWGLIMFILSIIPGIGTPAVWIPAGIIRLFQGNLYAGIGILVYGIILTIAVEFFLKNRIIVHKSRVHPLLVLLGVFGGLKFLGFVGIIIGPLVLGLLIPFTRSFLRKNPKA